MNTILRKFIDEPIFDACAALLNQLHITFNEVTRTPVSFDSLYPGMLPKTLQEIMGKVEHTYFIGTVDEASLSGEEKKQNSDEITQEAANGRYAGMMIFATEIRDGQNLTRTEMAMLTRGFNRIASAQPVVLFIKQNDKLALATCERSDYTQQWRDGEKLGKVSLLRDINCKHPHRGHIDILESIGDKAYPTFEELYKHWMQVFSSELLTKKFYSELSDWYAWAVQVVRFPNDLDTTDDDEKFNHESCIRLITRLIFVWFLKQKHLIPEEYFDEDYIRNHFIENFDPHDRENMLYNPEKSKYYRLILQNLFFAMLNCPIVEEGKDTANNRKFRGDHQYGIKRDGYNVNNLMRYKADFKEGGADEFVQMANNNVPFLNGGLFDCLDDKPNKVYYDGFSERKESLEQLYLPDWLFFGEEVGRGIDLSQWYDDSKKRNVSARGIIDILKRYNFTIEENTPLDQEVSLDPELLGKAFENLLASYNPETKTSARKQTGSFYTPREIVQYMVDESLVAHLKRICGDELEPQYRALLSYSTEETTLDKEQRRNIMQAIYHCRVLDPACGSGAFPMGVLQQMVHILRQLDPTNEMWKEFMIDIAIEQSRKAFNAEVEEERKARLADIEEAFNRHVKDPDYARKLYLIENCIYGVDIQPIAVQISKLRFFISLVVDQKPSDDATHNFGIRPLPNLESKFVAANTLIPVEYDSSLVENSDEVVKYKEKLKELNHKVFLAKRNVDKQRLKNKILETRKTLAQAIEDTGFVGHSEAELLAGWDMFDQNASSSFFDAEWMFGVKDGFDIVIGNPPYVNVEKIDKTIKDNINLFSTAYQKFDLYVLFYERGIRLLRNEGNIVFITSNKFLSQGYGLPLRQLLLTKQISRLINFNYDIFDAATVRTCILSLINKYDEDNYILVIDVNEKKDKCRFEKRLYSKIDQSLFNDTDENNFRISLTTEKTAVLSKIKSGCLSVEDICSVNYGLRPSSEKLGLKKDAFIYSSNIFGRYKKYFEGKDMGYWLVNNYQYLDYRPDVMYNAMFPQLFSNEKLVGIRTLSDISKLRFIYDQDGMYCNDSVVILTLWYLMEGVNYPTILRTISKKAIQTSKMYSYKYIQGVLNSLLIKFYFNELMYDGTHFYPNHMKQLPIKPLSTVQQQPIITLVDKIHGFKKQDLHADTTSLEQQIDRLVYQIYGLNYDEVLVIDPTPPFTREEYEEA